MMIDQSLESLRNLEPQFQARIAALLQAAGGRVRVISGHRTPEQQQQLWNTAAKMYGPTAADRWVAQPGHSNHEKGIAVDFQGDLALAHRLAPQFGLVAPMQWEDWHFEPVDNQTNPKAYTVAPPGYPDPTSESAQTSTQHHLAALAAGIGADLTPAAVATARANGADVTTGSHIETTATTPTAGASPTVAPVTAPTPVQPAAGSTAQVIASPTVGGDTERLLAGQPIQNGSVGALQDATQPSTPSSGAGQTGAYAGESSWGGKGRLTPQQIYGYLINAGFDPAHAAAFTAISQRESGGNPAAHNGNAGTGDDSWGLFQINLLHGGWTNFLAQHGIDVAGGQALTDPATAARAAFFIWQASGLHPWAPQGGTWSTRVPLGAGVEGSGGQVTLEQLEGLA